jgi:outer membrane protein assembly factor BamB
MTRKHRVPCCLSLLFLAAATSSASGGNWPSWRGPKGDGISPDKGLPLTWSTSENVRWRVPLCGPGNSSPIVWGDRVFITQFVSGENRRMVMCFDRADGTLLWQSGVVYTEKEQTQPNNGYCTATPVTDGERIIALFGSAGLYCCDLSGKRLWHRELGKMDHMFGNASSPVLCGDLCIVHFGPDERARLIAVNKRTGDVVWEAQPPEVDPSERQAAGGSEGPGGDRGPGGPGGFGPGMFLAPQMFSQADKNVDQKLTKSEFATLADAWFDKLDTGKTGSLSQEQFVQGFSRVLPPPEGFGPPEGGPGGGQAGPGGGAEPAGFIGPGFFSAADADKNGSLALAELKSAFEKWFAQWDLGNHGTLTEENLRDGLNAVLPQPRFGGPRGSGGDRGPGGPGGPGGDRGNPSGSWSSPIVVNSGGHEEVVMGLPYRLAAYDPKTGERLWLSKGVGATIYATAVPGENVIVAMSSGMGRGSVVAVTLGGSGDVTESGRTWQTDIAKSRTGSGVIHEGHFYAVSDNGVADCTELKTGKTVWEQRLKGPGAKSSSWSSLLLAHGKIYVPNQSGDVFVFRAAPQFELLATNSTGESTNASLAASDGELFMRTDKSLWCFGKKP